MNIVPGCVEKSFLRLSSAAFILCLLGVFSSLLSAAVELNRDKYFEIAGTIAGKQNGKNLVLTNVLRHHVSTEFGKSYFLTNDPGRIEAIIEAVVSSPTFHDFSHPVAGTAPKLMVIKDFTKEEALALVGQEFVGVHVKLNKTTIPSNRVTLFFGIDKLIAKGEPWEPTAGVLLTGFPDNPGRPCR